MKKKIKKEDFINILVDCKGESEQEAKETAEEYRNDIGAYISDIGGDGEALREALLYLK